MKWDIQAEEAVSRVPFFVRKRVRKKVEEEAARSGSQVVRLEHVRSCQQKFLKNMESEVKGYQVETCFGKSGCPNRAVDDGDLARRIEELLIKMNLKGFLKEKVLGPLKLHHEFRVSLSDCPNACSRPQIVDVGLIGAQEIELSDEACAQCGSCVEICKENAVLLKGEADSPVLVRENCLHCGQCVTVCPSGTIRAAKKGYRVFVGGKLGRHPQLGKDLGDIYSVDEALEVVEYCVNYYLEHNREGERFGDILNRNVTEDLKKGLSD